MSFTDDVIKELLEAPISKNCCRKALLFGLCFGAKVGDKNSISVDFKAQSSAQRAADILKRQFSSESDIIGITRGSRKMVQLNAKSKAVAFFLNAADKYSCENADSVSKLAGFSCPDCAHSFLRGVFISLGTVNDPRKGYHLEISLKNAFRASMLSDFLSVEIAPPKTVIRGEKIGLYYKSNSAISDFVYYIGGVKSSFEFANVCIERDIRNIENRATNCVAKNISRSVEASRKQVSAIEQMESTGAILRLSEELRYTAGLRIQNPSVSLAELALMHEPPISKSGLNRRLSKILEEFENE